MKAGKTKAEFYDYEGYVAKFRTQDLPKTTDETYTPEDVYDCVVDYVGTLFPLEGKVVERPFYPGGDYRNYPYQPNGVVIDNPPFSILRQIVAYYLEIGHPFFLFAPEVVSAVYACNGCTVFFMDHDIVFDNGARINVAFVGNLTPQWGVVCASSLSRATETAPSQQPPPPKLKSYAIPPNMFHFSELSSLASLEEDTVFPAAEVCPTKAKHEGRTVGFGHKFLLSDNAAKLAKAKFAETALAKAKLAAARLAKKKLAKEKVQIPVTLTPEQEELLRQLNSHANP